MPLLSTALANALSWLPCLSPLQLRHLIARLAGMFWMRFARLPPSDESHWTLPAGAM